MPMSEHRHSSMPRVPGLWVSGIPEELWRPALDEANGIFVNFTAGQIGSNQKFFLNMPFPLSGEREAATPVFRFGDLRIAQIEKVVKTVFSATDGGLGFGLEHLEDLSRANVIVREYRPGQKISFHSDDELCGPRVFGIVLENGRPDMGLVLRKGSSGAAKSQRNVKHEDEYVLREDPGSIFLMEDQARYQWQHGLPPVPARRVSVTVRFFKKSVDLAGVEIPYVEENEVEKGHGVSMNTRNSFVEMRDVSSQHGVAFIDADEVPHIAGPSSSLTITLIKNNDSKIAKPLVINSIFSTAALQTAAKAKLRLKGDVKDYRYFLLFGTEVFEGDNIIQKHKEHILESPSAQASMLKLKNVSLSDILVYVGEKKEQYKGPQLKATKEQSEEKQAQSIQKILKESPKDLAAAYKCESNYKAVMCYAESVWTKWRYPKLRFYATNGDTTSDVPGIPCNGSSGTADLGNLIEHHAHLSVPECRELVQFVTSIFKIRRDHRENLDVQDRDPTWYWHFYSCLWDSEHQGVFGEILHVEHNLAKDAASAAAVRSHYGSIQPYTDKEKGFRHGRMVGIVVVFPGEGKYVDFRVEGSKALKGDKKRDGPLWSLEGGLNNWGEAIATGNASGSTSGYPNSCNNSAMRPTLLSNKDHTSTLDTSKKKIPQFKGKNKYQQQRGVYFSEDFVYFGGTTFLSTYYPLKKLHLDGRDYSSAAQFVMAEQARIFGDEERIRELEEANQTAQPHKLFDHKAPKNNERRLKGFDPEIWKKYRDDVMHRATLEKFRQNKDVRTRLLMMGPHRRVVEATEDPFWGSGIVLGSENFDNPDKWTGFNNMGLLLDRVAREIRREFPEEAAEVDGKHGIRPSSVSGDLAEAHADDCTPFLTVEKNGFKVEEELVESSGSESEELVSDKNSEPGCVHLDGETSA